MRWKDLQGTIKTSIKMPNLRKDVDQIIENEINSRTLH
jgi:hypothetical protein